MVKQFVCYSIAFGFIVLYQRVTGKHGYFVQRLDATLINNSYSLHLHLLVKCNCKRFSFLQIFTFEFGGSKRIVISGYDEIHGILVKNADISSNRSVLSLSKSGRYNVLETPG